MLRLLVAHKKRAENFCRLEFVDTKVQFAWMEKDARSTSTQVQVWSQLANPQIHLLVLDLFEWPWLPKTCHISTLQLQNIFWTPSVFLWGMELLVRSPSLIHNLNRWNSRHIYICTKYNLLQQWFLVHVISLLDSGSEWKFIAH